MRKWLNKILLWVFRKSYMPVLIVGAIVVLLLFANDETSVRQNMEYQKQISELQSQIKLNRDSAEYYRERRRAIETGQSDLEHMAREQFHMQRPTEDIYLIKE